MASTLPVTFTVEIDDPEGEVLLKNYTEKFYVPDGGYFKKPMKLLNTQGFVEVDIASVVSPIYRIIVINRDSFDPPPMTTLRLTINNGVNPVYYTYHYIEMYENYGIHRTYAGFVEKIEVSTTSITETYVDVILISKMDPPTPT